MAGFFKRLQEQLFGKPAAPTEQEANELAQDSSRGKAGEDPRSSRDFREPFFVQIGLDFGTAFCKCVCRDVNVGDRAWVHLPETIANPRLPFLIPSSLRFSEGRLSHATDSSGGYSSDGLAHVKMALERVALERWDDAVLSDFKLKASEAGEVPLAEFVEGCAVYLLGGILGEVRKSVTKRFNGPVAGDYLAVNMAVPVANAENPVVNQLFSRVLCKAWCLADTLCGFPSISSHDLRQKLKNAEARVEAPEIVSACFVYPEVSANVQCFVRSRTSSEGIYLFSDTGAGTVDQSVFIFLRAPEGEKLTYLHANVFPLGSGQIERIAAELAGNSCWEALESWREQKENGNEAPELHRAKNQVEGSLRNGTNLTVSQAKQKLIRPRQIDDLRVLFGGGGHTEIPYGRSVRQVFNGGLLHPDAVKRRRQAGESFELGLPIPADLGLGSERTFWMNRLTVAYGLSFERGELSGFCFPREVEPPTPDQLRRTREPKPQAPSKDEV